IAASFITFTGHLNSFSKLYPLQPDPRFHGSASGRLLTTTPGYPIDTESYLQSLATFLTPATICLGVNLGPDGNSRDCFCPVTRIFTWVPPISTTNTFIVSSMYSGDLRKLCALGSDNLH